MAKKTNYIVATQDRDLQDWVRRKHGIPLLYLHNSVVPTLEQPSEADKRKVDDKVKTKLAVREIDEKMLVTLKKKAGIPVQNEATNTIKKKRKKKNPNPLSCKKPKKIKKEENYQGIQNKPIEKKKRQRVKIPKHVIEEMKANKSN